MHLVQSPESLPEIYKHNIAEYIWTMLNDRWTVRLYIRFVPGGRISFSCQVRRFQVVFSERLQQSERL